MKILLNLGHWTRSLGKLSKKHIKISRNLKFYGQPDELCRKSLPAWRNTVRFGAGMEECLQKIVNIQSNLRNVGTYYVNSAQIVRNI